MTHRPRGNLEHGEDRRLQRALARALPRNGAWSTLSGDARTGAIVVSVHGTWGGRSALADDRSDFASGLARESEGPISFVAFRWSGRNHHVDRLAASLRLKDCLTDLAATHPEAPIFVVGHSHGGNIALYALRHPEIAALVRGVATLSTPYLHVARRPMPRRLRGQLDGDHQRYARGLAFLFLALELSLRTFAPLSAFVLAPTFGLACGLFLLLSLHPRTRLWPRAVIETPEAFERNFALPHRLAPDLLILQSAGDEASGALAMGTFFSWIVGRVFDPIIDLLRLPFRFGWLIAALGVGMAVGMVVQYPALTDWLVADSPAATSALVFLRQYHSLPIILLAAVIGALYMAGLALSAFCWLAAAPFGGGIGMRVATVSRVSAEATPPGGPWDLLSVPDSRSRTYTRRWRWMHDVTHTDELATGVVGLWIASLTRKLRVADEPRT